MFTINNLAILALAGTINAAPFEWKDWSGSWSSGQGWHHGGSSAAPSPSVSGASTSTIYDIATATVTMTGNAPSAPAWSAPASSAPVVIATTATPTPSAAAFYSAPAQGGWSAPASGGWSSAAPVSSAWASATSAAPVAAGTGYMAVVNQWRSAGGYAALSQDSTLEGNALKTAQDGDGKMVHELNPGSFAQVLAPGNAGNFESVYVGGWLCEVPSLPGLSGICSTESQGWDHSDGETGHADILTSSSYSKIGCALADGIWACDLAF